MESICKSTNSQKQMKKWYKTCQPLNKREWETILGNLSMNSHSHCYPHGKWALW